MATATFEHTAQTHPLLSDSENGVVTSADEKKSHDYEVLRPERHLWPVVALCLAFVGVIVAAAGTMRYVQSLTSPEPVISLARCQNPSIRHEWRTLSTDEKRAYIDAVVCLTKTPSIVGRNQTLFDDFPWIHSNLGKSGEHNSEFRRYRDACH
jgi:hypothetical protein